jgi:hypothetical protein
LIAVALAAVALAGGWTAIAQASAPPGFVGISSPDTFAGSLRYQDTQLAAMHAAGITLLRQVFDWASIERKPGVYDFAAYDPAVLAAAKDGIEVMPILFDPPSYLSARPRGSRRHGTYPPKNLASIAAFAQAAVRWYGPGGRFWHYHKTVTALPIRIWQIWNEENLDVYWLPAPSATAYTTMLADADRAIHALDPGAEVVSGGIPLSSLPGVNLYSYLAALLRAGAAKWMDTFGVNAYATSANGVIALLQKVRAALNSEGGAKVAMRVSEFGWSDVGPPDEFRLGPAGQATQLGDVVTDFGAERSALDLLGFVYYDWRDAKPYAGVSDFWGLHTGLLTRAGKPKPALAAFAKAANAL